MSDRRTSRTFKDSKGDREPEQLRWNMDSSDVVEDGAHPEVISLEHSGHAFLAHCGANMPGSERHPTGDGFHYGEQAASVVC